LAESGRGKKVIFGEGARGDCSIDLRVHTSTTLLKLNFNLY
jgi:hypothetical protein